MIKNAPIGVFDSGIGGFSVARRIIEELPDEEIIYLGDTARVPYGNRDPETIKEFARQLTRFLVNRRVKVIVVACNTMSALSLEEIKEEASGIPVIDVITPTVGKALEGNSKLIGVIGTRATIGSGAYEKQIKEKNSHVKIVSKACPLFVPLVEEGMVDSQATRIVVKDYLGGFALSDMDRLILSCTHYPMLKPVISDVIGNRIEIIDSAGPTTEFLRNFLYENDLDVDMDNKPRHRFFVTGQPMRSQEIANLFFDGKFHWELEKVEL